MSMGSSEQPVHRENSEEEVVDLDADTKESTVEVFLNEETAESPHKITLYYNNSVPSIVANKFPRTVVNLQIGREATLGRNKDAHILLYDKHMARSFATVTCRTNANKKVGFYLRNACDATKEKRIPFTDCDGLSNDLLPTQEVELADGAKFRLECVEFRVEIELGDLNAKTFGIQVSNAQDVNRQRTDSTSTQTNSPRLRFASASGIQFSPSVDSAHVGFSLSDTLAYPSEQVVPKRVVTPPMESRGQNQGQGQVYIAERGQYTAYPVTQVMPQQYMTGAQSLFFASAPRPQTSYIHHAGFQDVPQYECRTPHPQMAEPAGMHRSYVNHLGHAVEEPLLERRGIPSTYNHTPLKQSRSGLSVDALAQAVAQAHIVGSPPMDAPNPRGITIVANPSSIDRNPVLYPSPSNQRFRFPPPDGVQPASPSGLDDLPRGPPLGNIPSYITASGRSIDLHPASPRNGVTNSDWSEVNRGEERKPVEHDEKLK